MFISDVVLFLQQILFGEGQYKPYITLFLIESGSKTELSELPKYFCYKILLF